MPDLILRVEDLHKNWAGIKAVDGVSFDIESGKIIGLIGPNGSGKTTLIDCISGFTAIDQGTVLLKSKNITGLAPHLIARAGLTRTFQLVRMYSNLSLLDHFLLGRQEFDRLNWWQALLNTREARATEEGVVKQAVELLDLVGLSSYVHAPAGILSYGQQKLLALAMSLIANPEIILLDEPLAGVNPVMIDQIASILRALNKKGQTILIVEHNIGFIAQNCDRVIVLDSGRKIADGLPGLIWEDPNVFQAYIGGTLQV